MNKKLIAVALAALPVAAMADVTLYGAMKGSLQHDSLTDSASQNRVSDNTSVIGFKGNEDLGNGLKAIWQIESRVHLGTGGTKTDGSANDVIGSRDTFVGIDAGDIGTFRMGYLNNTLNDYNYVDQWQYGSTVGVEGANGLGIFTNSGDRLKNAVRYDSATFAGFSGSLIYGLGENAKKSVDNTHSTGASSNVLGLGLNYTYGDVTARYAAQQESNPMGQDSYSQHKATKQQLEVDYSANNLFVGLAYQWATGYDWADDFAGDAGTGYTGGDRVGTASRNPVDGQLKSKQAALSVAYTIGAFTPKFSYAKGWDLKNVNGSIDHSGYRQYVMGVDYALSKRTTVGLAYGNVKFDKNTSTAQGVTNPTNVAGAGRDVTLSTVAFTMAHSF